MPSPSFSPDFLAAPKFEHLVLLIPTERVAALAGAAAKVGLTMEEFVIRFFVNKLTQYEREDAAEAAAL